MHTLYTRPQYLTNSVSVPLTSAGPRHATHAAFFEGACTHKKPMQWQAQGKRVDLSGLAVCRLPPGCLSVCLCLSNCGPACPHVYLSTGPSGMSVRLRLACSTTAVSEWGATTARREVHDTRTQQRMASVAQQPRRGRDRHGRSSSGTHHAHSTAHGFLIGSILCSV